jgi:hypothetical protein
MLHLIDAGLKIIDKVIPDPKAKAEAKQKLIEMQQSGELKELELNVKDRDSARDLAKARGVVVQSVLSFLMVVGFFGALYWALSGKIPENVDNMYVGALLGTLGTLTVNVINFWFGSSNSSAVKNQFMKK